MTVLLPVTRPSALRRGLLSLLVAALSTAAQADRPFTHPALSGADAAAAGWAQASAAAPRLVGHPASPRWAVVHANAEHPAVQVARRTTGAVDPNTFLVQPPASTRWTEAPVDTVQAEAEAAARGLAR